MKVENGTYLLLIISLLLSNFSLAQGIDELELPENIEIPKSWSDSFKEGFLGAWEQCLRIWRKMLEFFKNIWNKYIVSFFKNIWEKIKAPFVRKVEETEEIIRDKVEEKNLWERFKDLFRISK